MSILDRAGRFTLGEREVRRIGFGAMQLAGPGVFGPPRDHDRALAVLRAAVGAGVNHIDTSDYYGPHVVNALIREGLSPYPEDLVIVSKLGARRGPDGSWIKAAAPADLINAVHDNLRNLGLGRLEVVNMRFWGEVNGAAEGPVAEQLEVLALLQQQGLIGHIGISNVTPRQVAEARSVCPIACVQNHYNLVHRGDDALIDELALAEIAYVPFFPLGGFSSLQSDRLSAVAARIGHSPLQVAQAWLLQRSPNILLIPGTSSPEHLAENLAVAAIRLDDAALAELGTITAV